MGGPVGKSFSDNGNKIVSNLDASRNKPLRDARAKELAEIRKANREVATRLGEVKSALARRGSPKVSYQEVIGSTKNGSAVIGEIHKLGKGKDREFEARSFGELDNDRSFMTHRFKTSEDAHTHIANEAKNSSFGYLLRDRT